MPDTREDARRQYELAIRRGLLEMLGNDAALRGEDPSTAVAQVRGQQTPSLVPGPTFDAKMKGIGQAVQGFIFGDLESGMPNMDIAGPVLNAANIELITEAIRKMAPKDKSDLALAYLKAKYPSLTNPRFDDLATTFTMSSAKSAKLWDWLGNVAGDYDPRVKQLNLYKHGNRRLATDYVDTGGHELIHANQDARNVLPNPSGPDYYQASPTYQLFQPKEKEFSRALQSHAFDMYVNQPVEAQANRGGATARKTFEQFLTAIGPSQHSVIFDKTPVIQSFEDFNSIVVPYAMEQYKKAQRIATVPGHSDTARAVKDKVRKTLLDSFNKLRSGKQLTFKDLDDYFATSDIRNLPSVQKALVKKGYTKVDAPVSSFSNIKFGDDIELPWLEEIFPSMQQE